MPQPTVPPWIQTLQQRDPEFAKTYLAQRERILGDGAIPAKYKILMTMIVDALLSHPDGVATIANRARGAGASEAEVLEAVEVAYLFGGTPAPRCERQGDRQNRRGLEARLSGPGGRGGLQRLDHGQLSRQQRR